MSTKNWPRVELKDVCKLIIDCVNKTAPTVEGPTPYRMIRTTNVCDGEVDVDNVKYVTEEVYEEWIRRGAPQSGDVILTREAPLGRVGLLRDDGGVFLGQRLVMYRADPDVLDNRFLLYSFMSHDMQGQMKALGSGSTVEHLRVPHAKTLEISLPPLPIQRRIGSILSAYDDLIENNKRRIELLEEMAQAVYREWFVEMRFPGHENASIRKTDALGPVPEGWEVAKLKDVAKVNRANVQKDNAPETIHYITISCVNEGRISDIEHMPWTESPSRAKRIVQHGDILWSKVRPNLKGYGLVLNPASNTIASTGFAVISPDVAPYSYLYPALTTENFVSYLVNRTSGAAYPAVKVRDFKNAEVLLPSQDVLKAYDNKVRPFYELKERLATRNSTLRRTRDLLLPRLVSGEVEVKAKAEIEHANI